MRDRKSDFAALRALMLLLLPALIAAAQSPIGYPRVGCYRDAAGSLRPVFGMAGNFILGDAEQPGVAGAACRGKLTVLKTEDAVELRDRDSGRVLRWPAPAGPALVAFPANGSAPLVFFPATSEWLRLAEGASARALPPVEGEPLAMSSADGVRAALVLRREEGLFLIRLSLAWGQVFEETALEGLHAPAAIAPDGAVLAAKAAPHGPSGPLEVMKAAAGEWGRSPDLRRAFAPGRATLEAGRRRERLPHVTFKGAELVVRAPEQEERRIILPAPAAAIEHLGEGWLRVALESGGHMALRLLPGREELYHLPAEAAKVSQ